MKKTLITAIAALAIPATALAANDHATVTAQKAAKANCHAQRDGMGKTLFHSTYGNNGLGKCISAAVRAEKANIEQAKSACADQKSQPKNAYGKCVSAKAKELSAADVKATVKAAKTCKAQRKASPDSFKAKNAFGKCVSAEAKKNTDS